MDFISKYFNKSTFASDGLCIPLTMKWLSERRTNLETQYFDSLADKNTHEELAHLKIDVYLEHKKFGQNGVDLITADYMKFKTGKIATISQKEFFPREDGLYAVTFWTPDKKTGHMIGIDINKENKKCTLFDVNHGIESSANRNAMEKNFIKSNKHIYNTLDLSIQKI